jgi:nuclear cap-binding protein subunit 1
MTPDERLRRLLIRVGEKSKASLAKNLDGLAKAVQVDIQQYEDLILDTLFDCVVNLGVKIPIHATLVGLITVWEPVFGGKVIQRLKEGFISSFENGDVFKLRHFVRFLGCLHNANVIIGADFTAVLKNLLEILKNQEYRQLDKDHIAHIIMSGLTFSGQALTESSQAELTKIMEALKAYMESRNSTVHDQTKALTSQNVTFLEDFWKGLQDVEAENKWKLESILTPHEEFERLKKCEQQTFTVELPEWSAARSVDTVNNFGVMKLVESDENLSLLEHCIVCEYLHDVMEVFSSSPHYAAEHIMNLPVSFDHKFLAMEAIFSYMLSIPKPSKRYMFYARIIIELFDKQPKVWPKAVGRCLLHLFEKMEFMDVEVRDRLAHWFAFHLNNFGNNWPWHKWNFVVNLHEDNPKRLFCVQVLRLQMHLGDWQRVMNSVSEPFNSLMPSPPKHQMKYITKGFDEVKTDHKTHNQLATDIIKMLNRKLSVEDVQKYIDTWSEPSVHGKYGMVEVFFTCLLDVGHTSHSHFLSYFKAYQKIVRDLCSNEEAKVVLLRTLHQFWEKSHDRIVVLIEKLHQYKMIDSLAIVKFVFEEANTEKHAA